MKVLVTGNAGSGKTTLAKRIGVGLSLPVFGLDSIVWSPGWQKTSAQERAASEERLISQPNWVVDGVSPLVQRAADVTIFLNVTRLTSYRRCALRNRKYLFRSRPGLPADCPEIFIIPRLCKIIWRFPQAVLPRILEDAQNNSGAFLQVGNIGDLNKALVSLGISDSAITP